jgi:hypothetical protein
MILPDHHDHHARSSHHHAYHRDDLGWLSPRSGMIIAMIARDHTKQLVDHRSVGPILATIGHDHRDRDR